MSIYDRIKQFIRWIDVVGILVLLIAFAVAHVFAAIIDADPAMVLAAIALSAAIRERNRK